MEGWGNISSKKKYKKGEVNFPNRRQRGVERTTRIVSLGYRWGEAKRHLSSERIKLGWGKRDDFCHSRPALEWEDRGKKGGRMYE